MAAAAVCTLLAICTVVAVGFHLGADTGAGHAAGPPATDGAVHVAGTARPASGTGFTLGELAAGSVSPERFDAFWDAEVQRHHEASCPVRGGPGATVVTAVVGATPPPHLGEAYVDHAPRVEAAIAALRERCA